MTTADESQYQNDPSSLRSPQGPLLDYLLWDRLSKFWSSLYRQEDREALNAIYEAAGKVLDAEMVRLAEINAAKGIFTCPIYAQRRWVRLDLNRYAETKAFLEYAIGGRTPGQDAAYMTCDTSSTGEDGSPDLYMNCMTVGKSHAGHWHIHFTWTLPDAATNDRLRLALSFPVHPALIEIWRMYVNGEGRLVGDKLIYGVDFSLLPDGTTVQLANGIAGDQYDVSVGLNFSDRVKYDGRLPAVKLSTVPHPGVRTLAVPPEFDGYPVHVQVVRNAPPSVGLTLQDSNNLSFTTTREFYPNAGQPASGIAVLPSTTTELTTLDRAFVFGLERVEDGAIFDRLHAHANFTFYVTSGAASLPPGVSQFVAPSPTIAEIPFPNGAIPLGLNSSIDYLGQEVRVFVDGKKLHSSEYSVGVGEAVLKLRVPMTVPAATPIRIDVQYTNEYIGLSSQTLDLHNHITCYKQNAEPIREFATFDDGGDFDEDPDAIQDPPWGLFDSSVERSALYLADVNVDPLTLRTYADGRLLHYGIDYNVTIEPASDAGPGRTRLLFGFDISGMTIEVTYRRVGSIANYGAGDIFSGGCTSYLTPESLDQILGNVGALLFNFSELYGTVTDPEALINAVRVVAAGGNPLLTLFGDEFSEYLDYPIDAPGAPYSATDARAIESANTDIASIPVLVDHPHRPTVRLYSGQDYTVRDGGIASSLDLTAPRSSADMAPGVWWCPVLLLDERTLAKTFGFLVGDVRKYSTPEYKNALIANHLARFSGPVATSLESAASVFLGSPIFRLDGKISSIRPVVETYRVSVRGAAADKAYDIAPGRPLPVVGNLVFAGQPLSSSVSYQGTLGMLTRWTPNSLTVHGAFPVGLQAGDLFWIELLSADETKSTWIRLTVEAAAIRPASDSPSTYDTFISFKESAAAVGLTPTLSSRVRVVRPAPPPFAEIDGVVESVTAVEVWEITTSQGEVHRFPYGVPMPYYVGSEVRRGDAVVPTYATLYDDAERPNWHWLDPQNDTTYQHLFNAGKAYTTEEADVRQITIYPEKNGLSKVTLSLLQDLPPRGSKMSVVLDGTGVTEQYDVVGKSSSALWVTPAVSEQRTGMATFDRPAIGVRSKYFEVAPVSPSPTSGLAAAVAVGAASLQLQSTVGFPPAGRVGLKLGGGSVEVDYYRVAGNFLSDLVWGSMDGHDGLRLADGHMGSVIQPCPVVLLSEYTDKIINPAMEVLIKQRVVRDSGTSDGSPRIDDITVDEYYRLFKNNSSVLEMNRVGIPTVFKNLLNDVVPPSTTLVTLATHVLTDVYEGEVKDG
jgi:hypothetical protein